MIAQRRGAIAPTFMRALALLSILVGALTVMAPGTANAAIHGAVVVRYSYDLGQPHAQAVRSSRQVDQANRGAAPSRIIADRGRAVGLAATGVAAEDAARLASRTDELTGALDPIAQNSRTSAVMSTREGTDVLAGGGRDLSPAQRALGQGDDIVARSPAVPRGVVGFEVDPRCLLAALDRGDGFSIAGCVE